MRTALRSKGNADPLDIPQWPCDRQQLIDDLWAVALASLADMPTYDKKIAEHSSLIGRDLQPWRSILAVAAWLDKQGVAGLWDKIEALAAKRYQAERIDLEKVDINRIAMLAIAEYVAEAPTKPEWSFSSQAIVERMYRLIDDEEMEISKDIINPQMLGHRLKKMRLSKAEYPRPRPWKINRHDLITLFSAYRVPLSKEIAQLEIPASGTLEELEGLEGLEANASNYANASNVEIVGRPGDPEEPVRERLMGAIQP